MASRGSAGFSAASLVAAALFAASVQAQAPVPVPAPASDFAAGALACGLALGGKGIDTAALERAGWTVAQTRGPISAYRHDGNGVRLVVSAMFAGQGQCVVDGYAVSDDQYDAIRRSVRDALAAKYGADLTLPQGETSPAQAFVAGNLMQILTTEKRPAGLSVRITSMRIPAPTASPGVPK